MSAPLSPAVQVRTEALRRVLSTTLTHSWEFSCWEDAPDDEPRIRDTDAATQLGYAQPRDVRKLIERIWPENQRPNCRDTVARQPVGPGGKGTREYKVSEYWLTEAQLLKLIARSETPVAESILDEMIAVYMAVRRHLATTVAVKAHERALPAPKALPEPRQLPLPTPELWRLSTILPTEVINDLRWAASQLGMTPGQTAAAALTQWAEAMKWHRRHNMPPQGVEPGGQYLMVLVGDGTYASLSRGVRALGLTVDPINVATNARNVLGAAATMSDAFRAP